MIVDRSVLALFCYDGVHEVRFVPNLTDAVIEEVLDSPWSIGLALPSALLRMPCPKCGEAFEGLAIPRA